MFSQNRGRGAQGDQRSRGGLSKRSTITDYYAKSNANRNSQFDEARSLNHSGDNPSHPSDIEELKEICRSGFKDVAEIKERMSLNEVIIESKFNDQQRELDYLKNQMASKIEISGFNLSALDSHDYFSIKKSFTEYLTEIGVRIESHEIIDAFIVSRKFKDETRQLIIMTFAHPSIKFRIMKEKIDHDKSSGSAPNVYFNYVLPKETRILFMEAKKMKREKYIDHTWVRDTKVLIRISPGGNQMEITSQQHLFDLLGQLHNPSRAHQPQLVLQNSLPPSNAGSSSQ